MKFLLSGLLFIFLFSALGASAQDETVDTAMIRKIREEGLQHSQVQKIAHQLTDVSGADSPIHPAICAQQNGR